VGNGPDDCRGWCVGGRVVGFDPLVALAELEEGPASAFRERSAMVAILDPVDGVGLALDEVEAEGWELPLCPSLAFCLAIRSCSIWALPDKTGGKVGVGSAGVAMVTKVSVEPEVFPGPERSGSSETSSAIDAFIALLISYWNIEQLLAYSSNIFFSSSGVSSLLCRLGALDSSSDIAIARFNSSSSSNSWG
jgi:hypothetical protein